MKVRDYEYKQVDEDYDISDKRKEELIEKVKNQIRKGFIAHYQILDIGKNDEELDFLYTWLDDNEIEIRGINGTISGELDNFSHIPKMGQSLIPEVLDAKEQENLFWKLNNFSEKEKKENIPEYKETRNKLIEHSMKLAKWVTNFKSIRKIELPEEDKYQMAYMGLIRAVDRFDPSYGFKFSTFAVKTIYREIIREVYRENGEAKQNFVVNEQVEMISQIKNEFHISLGREPEQYEIAEILGVSLKKVNQLETLINLKEKDSLEEIQEQKRYEKTNDEQKIMQEEAGYIEEGVYIDEDEVVPEGFRIHDRVGNEAICKKLKKDLLEIIDTLPDDKYKKAIIMRFGLLNNIPMTDSQIAKKLEYQKDILIL